MGTKSCCTVHQRHNPIIQYTAEKDDTLQKISKKFYDSYSKWTRIYEANKSVIPNPDRIKPGTVLQIPMD
ncbi:MAG: LysM peptidoglycan-binding domain-containing protein [Candidatus Omnitrophica bacterium]|nr:LysM peptidoglycan-binding domain-containing protein [Candidatus Omnitrophota bacterium]